MKKTKQKSPVRLKGVGDSLCVSIDPVQPVDILKQELDKVFQRIKDPSPNAKVTVDVGQEDGYDSLIADLGHYLQEHFGVVSVTRHPVKRPLTEERMRLRDLESSWHNYRSDVLMLAGRVRSGQKVTARNHLMILGDVNPGGEVFAGGDIIILGSLCGIAVAGQPENEARIVLALDFRPTQVQIGGVVAAGLPPSETRQAEYAHVENGTIVVDDYLTANPFGRMPWPQVR